MRIHLLLPAAAAAALSLATVANAQTTGTAYTVSYVEVAPAARDRAAALLKEAAVAGRKAAGNLRYESLQRRERPNHFAIVEAWSNAGARDAHAAQAKEFRARLQPLLVAAYDERAHTGLAVGALGAGAGAKGAAVFAVTHVDFIPPKKDEGVTGLEQLAVPSRAEGGNLRYEVLQQANRPNHLTLVEIWQDHAALERHEVAAHTVKFREAALPMSGALFDQRLYSAIE